MKEVTKELAAFLSQVTFQDLPPGVVEQAKKCLLDFIGVALCGARTPLALKFFNFIKKLGGKPEASVIGFAHKTSCPQSALLNGFSAHGLELDDGHIVGHVHPAVTVIPAALAVGEKIGASGKDLLTAMVSGYETVIRVGDAVTPSVIYDRGIHAPGLVGAFGAAAAVGTLFRLDALRMTHAIGNSCLTAVSPFQTFIEGAAIKDLYGGWPALVGTLAAMMAKEGFSGPENIFEGPMGFCRNVADAYNLEKITEQLGSRWRILEVYFKKHASCSFSHTTMDAVLEIVASHPIGLGDIERVIVKTHRFACDLNEKNPRSLSAKKSSIPYCVAAAILKRTVFLDAFDLDPTEEQAVLGLAQNVDVRLDPEMDRIHASDEGRRPSAVEIFLKNGEVVSAQKEAAKGWPEDPLSSAEFIEKFNGLIQSSDLAAQLIESVSRLENTADIRRLTEQLAK